MGNDCGSQTAQHQTKRYNYRNHDAIFHNKSPIIKLENVNYPAINDGVSCFNDTHLYPKGSFGGFVSPQALIRLVPSLLIETVQTPFGFNQDLAFVLITLFILDDMNDFISIISRS
jgi:hypothetical protein